MSQQAHNLTLWTLTKASREFSTTVPTLKAKLDAALQRPTDAGLYMTGQIVIAMFTDAKAERARLTREQADKLALENAQTRRELVRMEDVERVWAEWFIAARNAVKEQEMPTDAKLAVLAAMRDVNAEDYFKEDAPLEHADSKTA